MLVYRVFTYDPMAPPGVAGHPLHVYPQGKGRLDNPGHYRVWYFAIEAPGAIGETFGDHDEWTDDMFLEPRLPTGRRALGVYRIDDGLSLLDLDDAQHLLERGLRPTQVVERNIGNTQQWALRIYQERNDRGDPTWCGVRWWSYHRPQWRIIGYWGPDEPELVDVQGLDLAHPAVRDAAAALTRPI